MCACIESPNRDRLSTIVECDENIRARSGICPPLVLKKRWLRSRRRHIEAALNVVVGRREVTTDRCRYQRRVLCWNVGVDGRLCYCARDERSKKPDRS